MLGLILFCAERLWFEVNCVQNSIWKMFWNRNQKKEKKKK